VEGAATRRPVRVLSEARASFAVWRMMRAPRVPGWIFELVLLGALYGAYELGRAMLESDLATAMVNGGDILHWERSWHLAPEHTLNQLMAHSTPLAVIASYYYAALHYLLTPAVLIWMYRERGERYRIARTSLVVSTALGLIGFYLLPTAPPRLLPGSGIRDTLADVANWGWWSGDGSVPRGLGGLSNQFAAMPSLHVGWALWCGVLVARFARHVWLRCLAALYPVGTAVVVLATGNHYLLDVFAGVATMAAGTAVALLLRWLRRRRAGGPPMDDLLGRDTSMLEPASTCCGQSVPGVTACSGTAGA